jgi:hypothetical protein
MPMTELLHRHKLRLGERLIERDLSVFDGEIVPSTDTEAVQVFTAELSPMPPVVVPLREDDEDGIYGWPADGVRQKISNHGGSISFGWRLREWPEILLAAEFHAVWVDADGALVDITPAVTSGETSLFVSDPNYPETFDSDQRQPTRYKVLHSAPDRSEEIAQRIAQMKPGQRAYEARRAHKAGRTLEEWVLSKYPADPLLLSIAAYIETCNAFEKKLATLPDLIETDPYARAEALADAAAATVSGTSTVEDESSATDTEDAPVTTPADAAAASEASDEPDHELEDDWLPSATDTEDAPVEATAGATGETEASDELDHELEDDWLPENETILAEEEIYDWSITRSVLRRAVLHLMP